MTTKHELLDLAIRHHASGRCCRNESADVVATAQSFDDFTNGESASQKNPFCKIKAGDVYPQSARLHNAMIDMLQWWQNQDGVKDIDTSFTR